MLKCCQMHVIQKKEQQKEHANLEHICTNRMDERYFTLMLITELQYKQLANAINLGIKQVIEKKLSEILQLKFLTLENKVIIIFIDEAVTYKNTHNQYKDSCHLQRNLTSYLTFITKPTLFYSRDLTTFAKKNVSESNCMIIEQIIN